VIMCHCAGMEAATTPARVKPRLRGVSHLFAAIIALPAAIWLTVHAASESVLVAAIYGASVVGLLSSSALYHTPHWSPEKRMMLRRLDRSMIYVLIAGSYTPYCVELAGSASSLMLPLVWVAAALGIVKSIVWIKAPRLITAAPYVLLGWAIVPYGMDFYRVLGTTVVTLTVVGGVCYTLGAVAYARKWPDPIPAVFGYHEVFHALVVVALGCHYTAVWMMVGG